MILLIIAVSCLIGFEMAVNKADIRTGKWSDFSFVKIEKAKRENIPVLIYFRADWCDYCLDFEREVMEETKTKKLLEKYFLIIVDRSNKKNLYTKIIKKKYDVIYFPTVIIIENNQKKEIPVKIDSAYFNSFILRSKE